MLSPTDAETAKLEQYDFALNSSHNGGFNGVRDVDLNNGKKVEDYPVQDENMNLLCACVQYLCTYMSEE